MTVETSHAFVEHPTPNCSAQPGSQCM